MSPVFSGNKLTDPPIYCWKSRDLRKPNAYTSPLIMRYTKEGAAKEASDCRVDAGRAVGSFGVVDNVGWNAIG